MQRLITTSFILGVLFHIASCSSSDDNSNNNPTDTSPGNTPTPSVATGVFIDSAVQGLTYTTPSRSGTTNAQGEFQYLPGESVEFSLFGQVLGSTGGRATVTPFDLAGSANNIDFPVNLTRLLITLDTDGDASNGISLPDIQASLNFNQTINAFENDSAVQNVISSNANIPLISQAAALSHVATSFTTLGQASSDYRLDLSQYTVSSSITIDRCPSSVTAGWQYNFTADNITLVGSDGFDSNCTASPQETLVDPVSVLNWRGFFYSCTNYPVCSLSDLSRTYQGPDFDAFNGDGTQQVRISIFHVPGSNRITWIQEDLEGGQSRSTFVEVVTLTPR